MCIYDMQLCIIQILMILTPLGLYLDQSVRCIVYSVPICIIYVDIILTLSSLYLYQSGMCIMYTHNILTFLVPICINYVHKDSKKKFQVAQLLLQKLLEGTETSIFSGSLKIFKVAAGEFEGVLSS